MINKNKLTIYVLLVTTILAGATVAAGQTGKSQPVARVLKIDIFRVQIEPGSQEQTAAKLKQKGPEYEKWLVDYQGEALASTILNPLLAEYAKAHRITATTGEINSMSQAVFKKRVARGANKMLAQAAVIQWKVSKALYQQYGGIVIFQQSNPYEPIGAYAKFLEEQEQMKTFQIFEPKLREAFWCYFTCEQSMIVPPNEVNYDQPWWLQKKK